MRPNLILWSYNIFMNGTEMGINFLDTQYVMGEINIGINIVGTSDSQIVRAVFLILQLCIVS